ncbi:MAG: hypothetical protein K9J06_09575, partial [Flavobacteriales bacterium]|nr:hypothetical protein [Flavobacteriales bacterium]
MKSLSSLLVALLLAATAATAQTNYTWTGATGTDWGTATNWSPASVPGAGDRVIIGSTANAPVLDTDRTVLRIKQTAGTIDLDGHTLTVTGTAHLTNATVTDGMFLQTGTRADSSIFTTVNFDCKVDMESSKFVMYYSTFADSTRLSSKGNKVSYGAGNDYEGVTHLLCKDTSSFQFSYGVADTFFTSLTITNTSKMGFILSKYTNNNYYGGDVRIEQLSTGSVSFHANNQCSYFAGDLILRADQGGVAFVGTGAVTLAPGSTIKIDSAGFTGGLVLYHLVQQAADTIVLDNLGATTQLDIGTGSVLKGHFHTTGAYLVRLANSRFEGTVNVTASMTVCTRNRFMENVVLTRNGGVTVSNGGNRFYKDVSIVHAIGSSASIYGLYYPDTVMGDLSLTTNGTGYIAWAWAQNSLLYGDVTANAVNAGISFGVTTNGKVTLCGTGDQNWTATTAINNGISHRDLRIDKPSGNMVLNGTADIYNNLQLVKGYIRPQGSGSVLRVRDNATVTGTSDSSHVQGPVSKVGNDAFTF